ncbi:hypothetical protein [Caudoviricetes sp.]|nr:hypothetical protein [Caudoviricetes sp.]
MSSRSKRVYEAEIEHTVCGIPCIIGVTYYEPYVRAQTYGPPENCYPSEGGCGEYELLDRKGYKAAWLERKVDARVEDEIQQAIFDHMEN